MQGRRFAAPQTADKGRKRRKSFRKKKNGRIFCLLCWRRLQNAVIYDGVNSLFCRLAALPCDGVNSLFCRLAALPCSLFQRPAVC